MPENKQEEKPEERETQMKKGVYNLDNLKGAFPEGGAMQEDIPETLEIKLKSRKFQDRV